MRTVMSVRRRGLEGEFLRAVWDVIWFSLSTDRAFSVPCDGLVSAWLQLWETRDPALPLPIVMTVGKSFESDDATLAADHDAGSVPSDVTGLLRPSSGRLRCFLVGEIVRSRRLFCLLPAVEPDGREAEA